jgi:antitoxin component YwqK of YwqJK toxin-antitoxin module
MSNRPERKESDRVLKIDFADLEDGDDDDWLYHGKPFTGVAYERYPGGQLRLESTIVEGIEQGLCRAWYVSGQLKQQYFAVRSHRPDILLEWHENGGFAKLVERELGIETRWREWDERGSMTLDRKLDESDDWYDVLQHKRKKAQEKAGGEAGE